MNQALKPLGWNSVKAKHEKRFSLNDFINSIYNWIISNGLLIWILFLISFKLPSCLPYASFPRSVSFSHLSAFEHSHFFSSPNCFVFFLFRSSFFFPVSQGFIFYCCIMVIRHVFIYLNVKVCFQTWQPLLSACPRDLLGGIIRIKRCLVWPMKHV